MEPASLPFAFQLAGFIISIVALLLSLAALLTLFQRIWGRPKVQVQFTSEDPGETRVLKCEVFNLPVTNHVLRLLGVQRETIEDLNIVFSVVEAASAKLIVPRMTGTINTHSGPASERARLPSSVFSARVGLVGWIDSEKRVSAIKDVTNLKAADFAIPPGEFLAKVEIVTSEKVKRVDRKFTVGKSREDLSWL